MSYIDGYVIPIPKRNLPAYVRMAKIGAKVWKDHGALLYIEALGDDLDTHCGISFPRQLKLKRGETALFSFIVYRSRAHRDRVNAKVMKDPRLHAAANPKRMPFDIKRMVCGGFRAIVKA